MDGLLGALGGLARVLFWTVAFHFDRDAGSARYGVLAWRWSWSSPQRATWCSVATGCTATWRRWSIRTRTAWRVGARPLRVELGPREVAHGLPGGRRPW